MAMTCHILPYKLELLPAFQKLNRIWIARYFKVEPEDERELAQAQSLLVEAGGQIFFACEDADCHDPDAVLGCVGVYRREEDFYEIIKLAVADNAQGLGLGRKLMQAAIEFIAAQGASRAIILSSRSLSPAMGLYTAMGFYEVDLGYKHLFERCNIELVLPLN
ncbi:MAG: GNAT family N-acetyltransferase [Alphaproteobacteria bacterium]|nr:GNAT family N-acetyltransferase [Alphaproteobacteria bacterium]